MPTLMGEGACGLLLAMLDSSKTVVVMCHTTTLLLLLPTLAQQWSDVGKDIERRLKCLPVCMSKIRGM
jgi:hypothetical protein